MDAAPTPTPPRARAVRPARLSGGKQATSLALLGGGPSPGSANIRSEDAAAHVYGLAVGIDLTRRDVQIVARKAGRPWEIGKAFDHSAPVTAITPLKGALPIHGAITLAVNAETRQAGDLAEMVWNCAEIVAQLSGQYRLEPGDLIYTGTPAGVGPLVSGDRVTGSVEGVGKIVIDVVSS